jgi:hypothetical protein
MEAVFLGIIATSMIFMAIFALIRTIVWILVLIKLMILINDIRNDYKTISPKIIGFIQGLQGMGRFLGFMRMFRRRK